jgi:chromosome segregation ATPase
MFSLTPSGSPAETSAALGLFAILGDPKAAEKRLKELIAEKVAAIEAMEISRANLTEANKARAEAMDNARAAVAEAKQHHDNAASKLAEAKRVSDAYERNHETRTNSLDERHQHLVDKDKRLTEYEAAVSAREKELGEPLAAREAAVSALEVELDRRQAALEDGEAKLLKAKQDLDARAKKISEALK